MKYFFQRVATSFFIFTFSEPRQAPYVSSKVLWSWVHCYTGLRSKNSLLMSFCKFDVMQPYTCHISYYTFFKIYIIFLSVRNLWISTYHLILISLPLFWTIRLMLGLHWLSICKINLLKWFWGRKIHKTVCQQRQVKQD